MFVFQESCFTNCIFFFVNPFSDSPREGSPIEYATSPCHGCFDWFGPPIQTGPVFFLKLCSKDTKMSAVHMQVEGQVNPRTESLLLGRLLTNQSKVVYKKEGKIIKDTYRGIRSETGKVKEQPRCP